MKRRRVYTALAIIVAVLLLGVGYAAIANIDFTINGTATASAGTDSDFSVEFTSTTVSDASKVTASLDGTDKHLATVVVNDLARTDGTVTATFTIQNKSATLKARISNIAITDGTGVQSYFTKSAALPGDASSVVVNPNGTTTVTVSVAVVNTPLTSQTATFTVTFDAEATE